MSFGQLKQDKQTEDALETMSAKVKKLEEQVATHKTQIKQHQDYYKQIVELVKEMSSNARLQEIERHVKASLKKEVRLS